jgi:hypothetical protein
VRIRKRRKNRRTPTGKPNLYSLLDCRAIFCLYPLYI